MPAAGAAPIRALDASRRGVALGEHRTAVGAGVEERAGTAVTSAHYQYWNARNIQTHAVPRVRYLTGGRHHHRHPTKDQPPLALEVLGVVTTTGRQLDHVVGQGNGAGLGVGEQVPCNCNQLVTSRGGRRRNAHEPDGSQPRRAAKDDSTDGPVRRPATRSPVYPDGTGPRSRRPGRRRR